jgi:hypothetical protein
MKFHRGQASVEYASLSLVFALAGVAAVAGTPVARGLIEALQDSIDYLLYTLSLPL